MPIRSCRVGLDGIPEGLAQRKPSAAFTLQPNCGVEAIVKAAVQQPDVRPVIVAHALQLPLMGADGKRSRMGEWSYPTDLPRPCRK